MYVNLHSIMKLYRGGLGMVAILVMIGTRYACHIVNMILILKGAKNACHINFVSDQVCLPSFLLGTRYPCNIYKI